MATTRTRSATTKPQVVTLPDTEPPEVGWVNPMDNPEKSNAEIATLLESTKTDDPIISLPPDDLVTLPGGLIKGGKVIRTAIVRELTGADEEVLSKAAQSINPYKPNPFHFIDRLLRCGVVQVGDLPEAQTESLLKEMLVGDREQLILGIRRATYGEELDVDKWRCTNCSAIEDLSMELADIPVVSLTNPLEEITFEVVLKKGSIAKVRLANGEDQMALYEKDDLTEAQRQTILLSRCVMKITSPMGIEQNVAGFPSLVLSMSIPDRHKIINELYKRQPGPKYDKVSYRCDACGEEVFVAVGLGHLFLDFGWI